MSVHLVGNSHVRHLANFISQMEDSKLDDIAPWQSFAVSGLRSLQLLPRSNYHDIHVNQVANNFAQYMANMEESDSVVLFIGDNDLNDEEDDSEVVAWRLIALASLFKKQARAKAVTLHQLLPRYVGARGDIDCYNAKASLVNSILKTNCKRFGLHFLESGFKFPGGGTEMEATLVTVPAACTSTLMGCTCPPLGIKNWLII